jgi:leucine dehydrogenase
MPNFEAVPADLRDDAERAQRRFDLSVRDITIDARRHPDFAEHERVFAVHEPSTGLDAFIAIHDTTLGPALGGCRMAVYPSRDAALGDALRLSQAMTYKAALAGLDVGGGKMVVIANGLAKSEALFRAVGRAVESLHGRYVTGEDVGTSVREIDWIAKATSHVIGTSRLGDPSPMTAVGVVSAIKVAVRHRLGRDELAGLTVAVQGLGNVGRSLCEQLAGENARLIVADIDPSRCDNLRRSIPATQVDPAEIHRAAADVFAPCALGGILNHQTVAELRCPIVVGSANNQLGNPEIAKRLRQRGILYAPDYVVNAGGLIAAVLSRAGHAAGGAAMLSRVRAIGETLNEIFRRADQAGRSPADIADELSEERIARRRNESDTSRGKRSYA